MHEIARRYQALAVVAVIGVLLIRMAGGSFIGRAPRSFESVQVPFAARSGVAAPPAEATPADEPAPPVSPPGVAIQRFETAAGPSSDVPVIPSLDAADEPAAPGERAPGTRPQTVAAVGDPRYPAALAVARSGDIWVGTDSASRPSRIFHFSPSGALVGAITVDAPGVAALAFGPDERLYVALRGSSRIVSIGAEDAVLRPVATVPDVGPCVPVVSPTSCDSRVPPTTPQPSALAFGPGGALYVGDAGQAAVWRVGDDGKPVWFAGDSTWWNPTAGTGVTGLAADGRGNLLVVVDAIRGSGEGTIDAIAVTSSGSAGERRRFATFPAGFVPSAIAVGRSGASYVSLAGAGKVAVLGENGAVNRVLADALDTPRGVALRDGGLYVAVQSLRKPSEGALVGLAVDDASLVLASP
jgi:sugar lactone lactonase YvrE